MEEKDRDLSSHDSSAMTPISSSYTSFPPFVCKMLWVGSERDCWPRWLCNFIGVNGLYTLSNDLMICQCYNAFYIVYPLFIFPRIRMISVRLNIT